MKTQTWYKVILAGSVAAALVGCGDPFKRESDPLRQYPELRQDVPPSQYKKADQNFDGLMFGFEVNGRHDLRQIDFFEGKETQAKIKAQVFIDGVAFSLKAHNLPAGASLVDGRAQDGLWTLKWRPNLGTIANGLTKQTYEVQIEFQIEANSTTRARELFEQDRRNRIKTLTLTVNFSDAQPTINVLGFDRKEYKHGDVVPFKIEVVDPNSTASRRPELVVTFDRNNETNEAKTFPASSAVILDPNKRDQFVGNGKWVFYRLFDTTTIPAAYLDGKTKFEGGEFVVFAYNPSTRLESIRLVKRFKVTKASAATAAESK